MADAVVGHRHAHRSDADLDEELRLHVELATADERRRGLPPDEAARAARVRAGGLAQAIERQRDQRALPWLEDVWRDVRYAVRTLMRARGFAVAAIASLAVGIGGNAAIFTLMDAVLFRTVPVHQPERLFFLGHDPGPQLELSANYPLYERYRSSPAFSGVTAFRGRTFRVRTSDGTERVSGQYVSGKLPRGHRCADRTRAGLFRRARSAGRFQHARRHQLRVLDNAV
jgi:hypothetical protein